MSDNGGGFEPGTVKAGNGLKNMRERAGALSARFEFVTRIKEAPVSAGSSPHMIGVCDAQIVPP